jgi:hypothetical protein
MTLHDEPVNPPEQPREPKPPARDPRDPADDASRSRRESPGGDSNTGRRRTPKPHEDGVPAD